jgi:hypothetical protein
VLCCWAATGREKKHLRNSSLLCSRGQRRRRVLGVSA